MNEQIDWSKAPADATHYHPGGDGYTQHWIKQGFFCVTGFEADGWMSTDHDALALAIPRPVTPTWNGPQDGLPPVGTVCEFRSKSEEKVTWRKAEVMYLTRDTIVLRFDETLAECAGYPDIFLFRCAPTAEQLAAEEREQGISQIVIASGNACMPPITHSHATNLYDAGARMPGEGSKA